jgi:SSS family solute:Na+ symporter
METLSINLIDIIILLLYILLIVWWGIKTGKSTDTQSYFLAGRSMPWWVVGLSLFAASISSTTLIGQSGDAYHTGLAVFNYNLTGVVVMVFFAIFLLPLYIRSKVFTIPEFLEKRFDRRSRYYFSLVCIFGNIFLDAAGALYAGALIIKLIYPDIDIRWVILIFAILAASYTIPGGLTSVIKTELVQAIILIIGSAILAYFCFQKGGDYFVDLFQRGDILTKLIRPNEDLATPWLGLIVGMPFLGIYFWANNQTMVQRVLSAKSVEEGRKGLLLNGFLTITTLFFIAMPGLISKGLFSDLESPDMVYPTMIIRLLPVGLIGIILAALLSALMSTLSAVLNSCSTLFTMDFYKQWKPDADSKRIVFVGKMTTLVIIVIATLWAPQIGKFGSLLKYYQEILSYISPPIVAAFLVGIFSKRVNGNGAFAGLMAGLVVAILLVFFKTAVFGDMHFLFVVPCLLVISIIIIYIVSLFGKKAAPEKLENTIFSVKEFKKEWIELNSKKWYHSYLTWSILLLLLSAVIWVIFS